ELIVTHILRHLLHTIHERRTCLQVFSLLGGKEIKARRLALRLCFALFLNGRVLPRRFRGVTGILDTFQSELKTPLPRPLLRTVAIPENTQDTVVVLSLLDERTKKLREVSLSAGGSNQGIRDRGRYHCDVVLGEVLEQFSSLAVLRKPARKRLLALALPSTLRGAGF